MPKRRGEARTWSNGFVSLLVKHDAASFDKQNSVENIGGVKEYDTSTGLLGFYNGMEFKA